MLKIDDIKTLILIDLPEDKQINLTEIAYPHVMEMDSSY